MWYIWFFDGKIFYFNHDISIRIDGNMPIFHHCSGWKPRFFWLPPHQPRSTTRSWSRLHHGQIFLHVRHGALDEFLGQTAAAEVLSDAQGQNVGQGATGATWSWLVVWTIFLNVNNEVLWNHQLLPSPQYSTSHNHGLVENYTFIFEPSRGYLILGRLYELTIINHCSPPWLIINHH